jgi:hypothetical protein
VTGSCLSSQRCKGENPLCRQPDLR